VAFSLLNDDGSPIDIMDLNRIRFQLSGPTDDYSFHVTETATDAAVSLGNGDYTYDFETAIPSDAEGSFAVGAEARRDVLLNPGTTGEFEYREQARDTPVFFFPVTDAEAVARRMIVDDKKCEECHGDLAFHGENRRNATDYCQMCHHPLADDGEVRPEEEMPPRTIDFKMLIHRIHTGAELENDYTVYGYRGSRHNYNEIHYVGDRRNCEKCHVGDSYEEARGNRDTITLQEFFSPMPPNSTACIGCHDSQATQAHAFLQIAPFGEACMACHGSENAFGVARVHAR
jgi:OmcA/MtrC family decaheme c-type cytochrome